MTIFVMPQIQSKVKGSILHKKYKLVGLVGWLEGRHSRAAQWAIGDVMGCIALDRLPLKCLVILNHG